jgi:hypothetical protein
MSACWPLSRKYSPIEVPANGAMYCIGAGSEAQAATTVPDDIALEIKAFVEHYYARYKEIGQQTITL